MAKKKITYLGTPEIINQTTSNQVPQYDDTGVSFKGYSKRQQNSNNYSITKQNQQDINYAYTSLFGDTHLELNRIDQDKDFYLSKLHFTIHNNGRVVGSVSWITLRNGANGKIIFVAHEDPAIFSTLECEFNPPLLIPKGIPFYIEFSTARIANEAIGINFYGWNE